MREDEGVTEHARQPTAIETHERNERNLPTFQMHLSPPYSDSRMTCIASSKESIFPNREPPTISQ